MLYLMVRPAQSPSLRPASSVSACNIYTLIDQHVYKARYHCICAMLHLPRSSSGFSLRCQYFVHTVKWVLELSEIRPPDSTVTCKTHSAQKAHDNKQFDRQVPD